MKRIILYGVGSPLVIDVEESCKRLGLEIAAAIRNVPGPSYLSGDCAVTSIEEIADELKAVPLLLPMFTPANRRSASAEACGRGFVQAATVIDPTSIVSSSTRLGEGSYVNAGCTIGGAGVLGKFVVVNRAASIGHHAAIEDFVSIGPGAVLSGFIHLAAGVVIGAGAVLLPKVEVGANSIVGAGAVVTKSVPADCVVAGNPARIVKPARRATETVPGT
jgi:sugar O-acyltransferase (sialic acid O-acetyltransferase NeuD family)